MEVLLLTKAGCSFCDQAKATLERLESSYPLTVSTVDLEMAAGRELAERAGLLFPPGLFLDGELFSFGRLSERRLRRELDRRLASRDR